LQEAM